MRLLFLIPLATGLVAGHISQKSADEISYLTGVFTFLSLLLSLILAPWQIQVVLLLVAIFSARKFWVKVTSPEQEKIDDLDTRDRVATVSPNSNLNQVVRRYRGVNYETHHPSGNFTEVDQTEKYRGQTCQVHQFKQTVKEFPKSALKYRGISLKPQPSHQKQSESQTTEKKNLTKDSEDT